MDVLIADFDLFQTVGGGQTFYRSVIRAHPEIHFYYLSSDEATRTARPANATAIPYHPRYFFLPSAVADLQLDAGALRTAANIAASVSGRTFDIIDVPDYYPHGCFLPAAMDYFGVRCHRFALSMHGNITRSIRLNWKIELGESELRAMEGQEEAHYRVADLRYGISRTYLAEWSGRVKTSTAYLDPLHYLSLPIPELSTVINRRPDCTFIGRTEKRKGPDLFLDLAFWLPRSSYAQLRVIGPSWSGASCSSDEILREMARVRGLEVDLVPSMGPDQLAHVFRSASVTFVPSRYDTLNFVALESLFSGCPTVVGSGAGVCDFLHDRFPTIPFICCKIEDPLACLPDVATLLENYQTYRRRLVEVVRDSSRRPDSPSLADLYTLPPQPDDAERERRQLAFQRFIEAQQSLAVRLGSAAARELIHNRVARRIQPIARLRRLRDTLRNVYHRYNGLLSPARQNQLLQQPERTPEDRRKTIDYFRHRRSVAVAGRAHLWAELARLERAEGNRAVAACYDLRAMRLHGQDRHGRLPVVTQELSDLGYPREAEVAEAMFGPLPERDDRCRELLDRAEAEHRTIPQHTYELIDDRRPPGERRVAVIVSLYKAAGKLDLFLRTLAQQSLIRTGGLELILVDSGSPDGERAVFLESVVARTIPVVYARSHDRETIQSAWNRGIGLARAPYLSFLGVDEAILPECLETLAGELDADPNLDWVQANSLVTSVSSNGAFCEDVMLYDRTGYRQDLVYLETCYLSWVGALYRRSIHDRFGYYDPTFRAAGDTELKGRLLPYIRTKCIAPTLGVFRNYPEERTTHHPRAELEDLRAWYLHRTRAGVRRLFEKRDTAAIVGQLLAALCYRKSFCRHLSSDIEYALNAGLYLQERDSNSPALRLLPGVRRLLQAYRELDSIDASSRMRIAWQMSTQSLRIAQIEKRHQRIASPGWRPIYRYVNDNRHEQHTNVW